MKRREALKHIGLGTGFMVVTPSLVGLLQSCTSDSVTWVPVFFTEEQGIVIKNIVDVILPKTDTPSATEVNVPEFIDTYVNDVLDYKDQDKVKTAFNGVIALIKSNYNEDISKVTDDNYKDLLDNHMLLDQPPTPEDAPMTTSDFLHALKWMTINAYRINEVVGETILAYDPVPGIPETYCISVEEATGGVAWSIPS